MPAYRDEKHETFYASFYYTDFTGARRKKMKRGFKLKRDAQEWERQFLLQRNADPDMKFGDFVEIYRNDKRERIREHTWESKDNMINTKILPYFKDRMLSEIEPRDVIAWQNALMSIRQKNLPHHQELSAPRDEQRLKGCRCKAYPYSRSAALPRLAAHRDGLLRCGDCRARGAREH